MDIARYDNLYAPNTVPAWFVNQARRNVVQSGVTDADVAASMRQTVERERSKDPNCEEEIAQRGALRVQIQRLRQEEKSRRGASRMKVEVFACKDADVPAQTVTGHSGLEELSPASRSERTESSDDEVLPDADLPAQSPTPNAAAQFSEARKESPDARREERRGRKKMVRAQQVKEIITVNQAAVRRNASGESRSPSIVAESSTAGATREALMNTTASPTNIMSSPFVPEESRDRYPVRPLPKWYTSINENGFEMKQLGRKKPQVLTALDSLKAYITQCQGEREPAALERSYEALRNEVHKAEIKLSVTKFILKKAKILNPETGLPAIFKQDASFPPDLKADSYQLFNRWYNQDFDQDILRGIITKAGRDRNNDRIDPKYRAEHPTTAKYYGEGDLVLGQWWPTQLCTVRDGAHGAAQGGIFGTKEKGTYSIVLSGNNTYHDLDKGTTIHYSGTESKDSTPTENTSHLLTSLALQTPIRVIRSHMLPKTNVYRPEVGLRYDGLYTVAGYEVVDQERAMFQFRLERCAGQEGMRWEGGAARRPTVFEVEAWEGLKERKNW